MGGARREREQSERKGLVVLCLKWRQLCCLAVNSIIGHIKDRHTHSHTNTHCTSLSPSQSPAAPSFFCDSKLSAGSFGVRVCSDCWRSRHRFLHENENSYLACDTYSLTHAHTHTCTPSQTQTHTHRQSKQMRAAVWNIYKQTPVSSAMRADYCIPCKRINFGLFKIWIQMSLLSFNETACLSVSLLPPFSAFSLSSLPFILLYFILHFSIFICIFIFLAVSFALPSAVLLSLLADLCLCLILSLSLLVNFSSSFSPYQFFSFCSLFLHLFISSQSHLCPLAAP